MSYCFLDFEYIESQDKTQYAAICVVTLHDDTISRFDLRTDPKLFQDYLNGLNLDETIFVGYNITTAEIPNLCQYISRDKLLQTKWIDLWVEFKMFALTHADYFTSSTGLSACMKMFGIEDKYEADKQATLELILSKSNYTEGEFSQIVLYCEQDVKILAVILHRLKLIQERYDITLEHMLNRGRHCLHAGVAYRFHIGYPMDTDRVIRIFENIPKIKCSLQAHCNQLTGYGIYKAMYKGPVKNKVFSHYQFNMQNFGAYLQSKGLFDQWEKTKTGLRLEEDYLDEMLSLYKDILDPVYAARNTIKQLNSTNLAEIMTPGGYIKSTSWPYNQKTSRTSPKPKLGFILNLTPWLRMLIKPKPGRAFVSIDFKSQEVLIAACLSQDESMLEDYLTDIYMGSAIKTGFAPEDATKKSHPLLREGFKPIVLGTNFGMQARSLSLRFFNLFKILEEPRTLRECEVEAEKYLAKRQIVYSKYYSYIQKHYEESKILGHYRTLDDWIYFVDCYTRPTQLVNVPCQSNGAAITRVAHDACVRKGIDVIQLHDALSFECAECDAVSLASQVSKIMCIASHKVLGYDYMSTETKIYTHDIPYYDRRGESVYRFVMADLGLECPDKFAKPIEYLNIHKQTPSPRAEG